MMVSGIDLFFSLFNNLAIFIALVAVYGYLLDQFKKSSQLQRHLVFGLMFGVFAIGSMFAQIPVFNGVLVDQRNAVIALSGAFCGPLAAFISAAIAGAFRIYLGGDGVFAGLVGVNLAAISGVLLSKFPHPFSSLRNAAFSAIFATLLILPGFLFVRDPQTGWQLLQEMAIPYGSAIFVGIFLVGLLLNYQKRGFLAEKAFGESEKRYRELVEGTPDLITKVDPEGRITFVNYAVLNIYGLPPEKCLGRSAFDFVHPEDREATLASFNGWLQSDNRIFTYENRIVTIDGQRTHHMAWTIRREHDEKGSFIGFAGTARDITERKRIEADNLKLEKQLQQAQRIESIGQLAGGVAHDFNNMLGVIIGHTELALLKTNPQSPFVEDLEQIHTAAKRSADLTRQLLTFARKETVTPRIIDLNETVAGMLTMLQRLIGENIQLSWQPDPEVWEVKMDPAQLDQILANLCVNARDAIADIGTITIDTRNCSFTQPDLTAQPEVKLGDYVCLSVSDDGHGIDQETLGKIFEPFFSTKELGQGTGLGLATVYGAVKQNQGFIDVTSSPGQGTTFAIYLPRQQVPVETVEKPPAQPVRSGTETILVVEDDQMLLNLTQSMLEESGYQVLTAATPESALALAKDHPEPIQLLLSDIIMPGINGKDLRDRLLAIRPELKILFMSGYPDDIIARQGILEQGIQLLQKPITLDALTTKVRQVLDQG